MTTGLAPTAAPPARARTAPEAPPCYAPYPACGALVLTGATPTGTRVVLDTELRT